ncbi:serine/threonine protein kinase [Methanocella sp. CWC-04]|uniref:non-specific serine/threonine protein kinase n=1 Tax=Methanooceanicella nereidis TaxID=2052831 RepID=A0AAP2RF74_9EURY|nr:lipopolysaccharide core heptose(II) kinase RfaY [Methanocella sp. CWC-04]MCD1296213.1 serine/threonine protein kinase [Methanocella sp. CWC-04]
MSELIEKIKTKRMIDRAGRLIKRSYYIVLNNVLVEWSITTLIAAVLVILSVIDKIFHTRYKRALISRIREISRDDLNRLRKTQIKYIFRKKYGIGRIKIRLAEGSYWLSIPCVVKGIDRRTGEEKKFLVKIINEMSAIKHKYMMQMRNLGMAVVGTGLKFNGYEDARDMMMFERGCLKKLRKSSVNTPKVLGSYRLNEEDHILVMEYIEGELLSDMVITADQVDQIFRMLKTVHDSRFVHGDIKLDNMIYSQGKVYFIDCLKIDETAFDAGKKYDLVCAISSIAEKYPVKKILEIAERYYPKDEIREAGRLLYVAIFKPDIDLPEEKVEELRSYFEPAP